MIVVDGSRTATSFTLSWEQGATDGGGDITNYQLIGAVLGSEYDIVANVLQPEFVVTGLTIGTTYEYQVIAENSIGYSSRSSTFTVLCATEPAFVTDVTTSIDYGTSLVTVSWQLLNDGSSPITSYIVYIQEPISQLYTAENVDCDGTQ